MKQIVGSRASSILYNWIISNEIKGKALVPANICESVPATYLKAGVGVIFCDISKDNWYLDINDVRDVLSKNNDISVVHYNHTYGMQCSSQMADIRLIKEEFPNVLVVEDRCLCIPDCKEIESDADIILYSTGPKKYVDIGYGGYAWIKSSNYIEHKIKFEIADLENFERHIKDCHEEKKAVDYTIMLSDWLDDKWDGNYELYFSEVSDMMGKISRHKKVLNSWYSQLLGSMSMDYNNWRYNILVENPGECLQKLRNEGLYASCHYMSLGNNYFSDLVTPISNYLASHVINLFNDFYYTEEQAKRTVKALKDVIIPLKEVALK